MNDIAHIGYPGNGQYPRCYQPVMVRTKKKKTGVAYWSGHKWVTDGTWRITADGPDKVVKWAVGNEI